MLEYMQGVANQAVLNAKAANPLLNHHELSVSVQKSADDRQRVDITMSERLRDLVSDDMSNDVTAFLASLPPTGPSEADRALTRAAARVAGIDMREGTPGEFCPLTDGGDALALAVALNLHIEPTGPMFKPIDRVIVSVRGQGHVDAEVLYGDDRHAAWRRAIVETAAALDAENQQGS
jgi:hypothetical protein